MDQSVGEQTSMWDHEAIHLWFSLSYSNYLVLNRSILQSMPDEWQKRFVECLTELDEATRDLDMPEQYDVRVLKRATHLVTRYEECPDCDGSGRDQQIAEEECDTCDGLGELAGEQEYEEPEEVGFKSDPIPHYNRGRARVPLRLENDSAE